MSKKNKDKINIVYSTNPDFSYDYDDQEEAETLEPSKQLLYVSLDRKQRAGKEVTLIEGFVGTDEDLKELGKILKPLVLRSVKYEASAIRRTSFAPVRVL